MLTTLMNWHHRRETVRELSLLSDRELADIGIIRSEIEAVARFAYEAPGSAGQTSRLASVRAAARPQTHAFLAGAQTQA